MNYLDVEGFVHCNSFRSKVVIVYDKFKGFFT